MRKLKISLPVICICLMVVIALSFVGSCGKSSSAGTKTLNIGSIWDMTGTGSDANAVMVKGETLCKDYINSHGGITVNGQKYQVNITTVDSQSTAATSVTAAQQLVFQNKVSFVIGQTTPAEVEGIRSITDPNKVMYIAGTDDTVSANFSYTFTALYPYKWPKGPEFDYLVKAYPNVKTVAVFNQDESGNMASGAESMVQIQKHGLTLAGQTIYPFSTTDYLPIVTKLVATKPDAIDMCLNMPSNAATIVKDARQMGYNGPILGGSPWDPTTELNLITAQYFTDFIWDTVDLNATDAQSQAPAQMKMVMQLWNDTYHIPFVLDCLQGWNPLWILKQAIEKANSLNVDAVVKALQGMKTVDTGYGTAIVGGLQTYGVNNVVGENVPLSRAKDGKAEFLGWFPLNIP